MMSNNEITDKTPTTFTPSPNSIEIYQIIQDNLEKWLSADSSRISLFSEFVENPTTSKILDQVNRRTPAGYGIVIEVINLIF